MQRGKIIVTAKYRQKKNFKLCAVDFAALSDKSQFADTNEYMDCSLFNLWEVR